MIRFFMQRVVGHWKRLPREVITAPAGLLEFREHLDITLRDRVGFLGPCSAGPGLGLDDPLESLPTQNIL